MEQPIDTVLLVDDCEADNYLHKRIIQAMGIARHVQVATCAEAALDFLRANADTAGPQPGLIFLDINIPGLEGWDFIKEFENIDDARLRDTVLVMLSGSLNPDDRVRAQATPSVHHYMTKPLTRVAMGDILRVHFGGEAAATART